MAVKGDGGEAFSQKGWSFKWRRQRKCRGLLHSTVTIGKCMYLISETC